MILFPIGTDRRLKSTPWVNYALIAANVLLHILIHVGRTEEDVFRLMGGHMLDPQQPTILQFLSYQFLHADFMHLAMNMAFLYIFGNSVEDRLGKVGYLFFYLAAGVLAGMGHVLTEPDAPVLGASGAVAGVSGAYLALFPMSTVTVFFWMIFVGFFEISSRALILFYIVTDIARQMMGMSGVAYTAHLAGYAFGFAVGMGLLWLRVLPREPYDMLAMWSLWRRRQIHRQADRSGRKMWQSSIDAVTRGKADEGKDPTLSAREQRIFDMRAAVSNALTSHDLASAAERYRQLLKEDQTQVMSQSQQLDLANQFMVEQRYVDAARAYELLLSTYPRYPQREQVELVLALVYARYERKPARAKELLERALPRLNDAGQKEQAERLLEEVRG